MGLNAKEACEQIKSSIDLFDVVSQLGMNLVDVNSTTKKINCPFHDEKDPSLYIENKSGCFVWHCFGCKKGGSAIDFYMEFKNVNIVDAIKGLAPNIELENDKDVGDYRSLRLDLIDEVRVEELKAKKTEDFFERLFYEITSHGYSILEISEDKLETANHLISKYFYSAEQAVEKQDEESLKEIKKGILAELRKLATDE